MINFAAKHISKIKSFSAKSLAIFCLLILVLTSIASSSYAALDYGTGRVRSCSDTNPSSVEGLEWDPTTGGKDTEFVLSNPLCLAIILSSYVAVKVSLAAMNYTCQSGSYIPRLLPSILHDSYDILKASKRAARSSTVNPACFSAIISAVTSLRLFLAEISIIYGVAEDVFENSRVCGANWKASSNKTYDFSVPSYKQAVENTVREWFRNNNTTNLTFENKTYREWFYGGIEVQDDPDGGDACLDPTGPKAETLGGTSYPRQQYYLRGLESGNFNCKKYELLPGKSYSDPDAMKKAHECCLSRSQNYICIEYNPVHIRATNGAADAIELSTNSIAGNIGSVSLSNISAKRKFCRGGEKCIIEGVTFETRYLDNDRFVCAETHSLCPYNFTLGGGTEYCDYYRDGIWDGDRWKIITTADIEEKNCSTKSEIRNADCTYNNKAGKCRNYCQYLTHCTQTSTSYSYRSSLNSPYFSEACLNFEGDSQNKASFGGGILIGAPRHFSTPIAQCVKETLENLFQNRAGHSKCTNVNEYPSADGTCPSGQYITEGNFVYKKGNKVKDNSFFEVIQNNLQFIVRLVLTLSIMFYGMNLLLSKSDIRNKKDILVYFLKIGLVMYFATGDAWQGMFFKGVYNASSELSRMVFKIKVGEEESKRDGCQFGRLYLQNGQETYSERLYSPGKEYLAMWDTLDCKIMRYLGFGPSVSTANVASLLLASFLTGPIGLYFAFSILIFAMLLIAVTIRALHIFLSSCISIIIMVFVSPIIIPLVLFEKTKNIFEEWLKQLISFAMQPMILFAYIAILIMVMDQTLLGSASYKGQGPFKSIDCQQRCVDRDGITVPYNGSQPPLCDQIGQKIINPLDDSVACLVDFNSFGKFPGLELIGISIPIVKNLFSNNVKERVLTILKGALIMYILYKFMDEIPGITSALIGGTKLPGANTNAMEMLNKLSGIARGIQKRLARGALKLGKKGASKGRDAIRELMDRGKNTEVPTRKGGADGTGKDNDGDGEDSTSDSRKGQDDDGLDGSSSSDPSKSVDGADDSSSSSDPSKKVGGNTKGDSDT